MSTSAIHTEQSVLPKSYTRIGMAIHHLGHLLHLTRTRTKVLIRLSDEQPEDCDSYKVKSRIEDTRHALLQMKQGDIHTFSITITNQTQEYLRHKYSVTNYAVIDEVQKFPQNLAGIYRQLTT